MAFPPGSGPRHPAWHPHRPLLYVCAELDSTLTVLALDAAAGLTPQARASTLPPGFRGENATADVHVHPSGRFAYVSNRGHDSLAVFALG